MFCQITKEKLLLTGDHYSSSIMDYPIKEDIIFMGYDKNNSYSLVLEALNDSIRIQGTVDSLQTQILYVEESYRLILASILSMKATLKDSIGNGIALNIGSGGDISASELALLGYDCYALDLEPNSLFLGKYWDIINNVKVKRIACDCSILPFPDNSVDLIYCKEFLHHIRNYDGLVKELSRVLKIDGYAVIIEPTLTHRTGFEAINFRGHYFVLNWNYLKRFKINNLNLYRYYLYYNSKKNKLKNKIISPLYNYFNRSFIKGNFQFNYLNGIVQNIFDGQNIFYIQKKNNMISPDLMREIQIEIINNDYLSLDETVYENDIIKSAHKIYNNLKKNLDLY